MSWRRCGTNGVETIVFSSTGSVYGETAVIPTPEDAPFPIQTSLYGASKLAGEGLIAAYAEGFGCAAISFVSSPSSASATPMVTFSISCRSSPKDPSTLHILGNGLQRKSYLHVDDCVEAMLTAIARAEAKVNIFNLGTDEYCEVKESAGWIAARLGMSSPVYLWRRRSRLDWRRSIHLPRYTPHPRARLAA